MRLRRNDRVTPLKDQAGCNCHSLKSRWSYRHLLPPANEVCEGYVYTSVCLSTGRVSATHTTPPEQTPPCPVHAGIHTHPLPSACWDTHPLPSECWDTVKLLLNKRAVRIPLECILVLHWMKCVQTKKGYDSERCFQTSLRNLSCCTYCVHEGMTTGVPALQELLSLQCAAHRWKCSFPTPGIRTLLGIFLGLLCLLHMCRGYFLFTFQPFCFKLKQFCWIYFVDPVGLTASDLGSNLNIISFTEKWIQLMAWYSITLFQLGCKTS